ncbi:hypothetical protein BKA56DRAFT_618131 [Ilyonectria sp. MPI-CAGE-AT-0026]|nr:hypothetical protein BKA56DRAFT_618131 [Ilyonectria sp. MPI-CAGE-AT-0026]
MHTDRPRWPGFRRQQGGVQRDGCRFATTPRLSHPLQSCLVSPVGIQVRFALFQPGWKGPQLEAGAKMRSGSIGRHHQRRSSGRRDHVPTGKGTTRGHGQELSWARCIRTASVLSKPSTGSGRSLAPPLLHAEAATNKNDKAMQTTSTAPRGRLLPPAATIENTYRAVPEKLSRPLSASTGYAVRGPTSYVTKSGLLRTRKGNISSGSDLSLSPDSFVDGKWIEGASGPPTG